MNSDAVKLFESLQKLKVTEENKEEVEKIKQDIRNKDFKKALERIEKIQHSPAKKESVAKNTVKNSDTKETSKRGRKKKVTEKETKQKVKEDEEEPKIEATSSEEVEKPKKEETVKTAADVSDDDFFVNDENKVNDESKETDNAEGEKDEIENEDNYNDEEDYEDDYDEYDDYDEFSDDPLFKKLKAYNDEEDVENSNDEEDKSKKDNEKSNDDDENSDEENEKNSDDEDKNLDDEESEENFDSSDDANSEEVENSEEKEEEDAGIFPKELRNEKLEHIYLGLLLTNPKLITKYYVTKKECYFEDDKCTEIYKSVLFTEGSKYTPEVAKDGFNLPKYNNEIRELKDDLMAEYMDSNYNIEEIYIELKKLFVLRKSYLENPIKENQDKIVEIVNYVLYKSMSVEEVESAVNQVTVTGKFKQAVLNKDLTTFLEMGDNTLTNGLAFPFPILSSVFKGLRKGETMAFAMPSNSGKSRFTINLAAYTAFVHKKKVLIISNEMSEDKMKLCLITTIINNPEIQKLHGQEISKTEGELLEFKFRPDEPKKVKVDENGFVVKEEKESQADFVKRLSEISTEFNKTIKAVDWANKEIENSIYFINITDHTNDELKKVIMNFYYKEKIEYVFYDTLKTDTANIGKGEEIKKTATILSNLAQNFNMFIYSTLQLTESTTLPINLDVNDLAVSRTVKEVLDTLCLIKQINKETYDDYEYSLKEVDTKYFDLKKYIDPDVRYYACVVDKNRAGAKPKVLFRLNLAYNRWEELGYLRMKQQVDKN